MQANFATDLTLSVQQFMDTQSLVSHVESIVEVAQVVFGVESLVVYQVWAVGVYEGVEP